MKSNYSSPSVSITNSLIATAIIAFTFYASIVLSLPLDTDQDGLPDSLEVKLKSNPLSMDTDYDGIPDGEELALKSDLNNYLSIPSIDNSEHSADAVAFYDGSELWLTYAFYIPPVNIKRATASVLTLWNGQIYTTNRITELPPLKRSHLNSDKRVLMITVPQSEEALRSSKHLAIALQIKSDKKVIAASDQLIVMVDDVAFQRRPAPSRNEIETHYSCNACLSVSSDTFSDNPFGYTDAGAGSIYEPIPIDPTPPPSTEDSICYQASVPVGASGGVITHEVVAADCIDNWDGFCRSDCAYSVGETYETFDPLALVGG